MCGKYIPLQCLHMSMGHAQSLGNKHLVSNSNTYCGHLLELMVLRVRCEIFCSSYKSVSLMHGSR